jgi:glutathione S-transferase
MMLIELGVEHQQIVVDIMAGEGKNTEFRLINPIGKNPGLVDDDIDVTEVAAIYAYLADKYPEKGLAPLHGSKARGTYEV